MSDSDRMFGLIQSQIEALRDDLRGYRDDTAERLSRLERDVAGLVVQNQEHNKNIQRFYAESYGPTLSRVERLEASCLETKNAVDALQSEGRKPMFAGAAAGGGLAALIAAIREFLN